MTSSAKPNNRQPGEPAEGGAPENAEGIAVKADELTALQKQLADSQAKADEWLDQYRRSVAEFANYRRRQERDREQQTMSLKVEVLRKLFPMIDDLALALQHVPPGLADTEWIKGIELIQRKIQAILADYEVVPIEALGQPFDPNYHFALLQEPSDQYPAGTVTEELRAGYRIGDRVIRPTEVKISAGRQS